LISLSPAAKNCLAKSTGDKTLGAMVGEIAVSRPRNLKTEKIKGMMQKRKNPDFFFMFFDCQL
jgi:hypothetical protein